MFDNLKDKANEMMGNKGDDLLGGQADQYMDGINFPAAKDDVIRQLEAKGVPSMITDKIRDVNTSQFDSVDDLKSKVGM